jgi:oligopeptide/dipeptide ABC transporter ATP-binding protein
MSETILEIKNLVTSFKTDSGKVIAVDDVSFSLKKGQTLGLVGESGCGKSVTSLSIMRLIATPPGKIESGSIVYKNSDLLKISEDKMRKIRGNEIAMIFQEPMTSLNPVFTCGEQIEEVFRLHQPHLSKLETKTKVIEMLKLVGIPAPEQRYGEYPHQLSGGMRQRIMIAMSLSCNPSLLIADEPTTALDVTIQAQILDLLRKLQQDLGSSLILITHDLGVVAEMCTDVAIMYAGRIVEYGTVEDIFYRPQHPYTKGLLDSSPHFETGQRLKSLKAIPGMVPSLSHLPKGCRFKDRCQFATEICVESYPELKIISNDLNNDLNNEVHKVSCFHPLGGANSK